MNKWILLGVATLMVSPAWGQHQNIRKGGGSGGTATATNALNSLNGISGAAQPTQGFAVGTSGSDFNISSAGATHTFNLPDAASGTRGLLTGSDWLTFNTKAPTNAPTLHTPVLLGPVIADFTSSQHGHLNVSSGGTLNASAIGSGVFPSARYGTNIITDQSLITPAPADRLLIVDDSGAVLGSILWSDIEAIAGEGSGDVVKDGTVADQQIGLWTGDGTLGSSATFVYNGTNVLLSGAGATNAFGSNYVRTASNDTLFLGANGQNLWEFLTTGTITPGTAGAQGIGSTAKPIGSLKTLSAVVGALQATNLTALESIDATTESTLEAALDLDDLQGTLSGNKVGTGIAADNITTDTLSDARLSSAVALTNVANTFHNPLRLIGGTSVTTSSAGQFDFDTDAYGAGRGAYQYFDGTDNTLLVMVDPLDSPSEGDRLTFRSGDLPDWQPDSINIAGTPGAATQLTLWQDANTLRFVTGLNYNTNINFLSIPASGGIGFNSLANLSDSSGTTTLMRIDAIDATTKATLESAIGPIVTNLAYASSQTLSGHISTQAFQTNSLTGNTSILLTNGVAGKSFKMSFLSDGSARTISFFSDLPMTWMSTNGTVNATNFQSVASKRGTFYGEYINVSPTQVGIEMWGINAP